MKKILILFSTIITLFSSFAFAGGHKHDIVDTAVKAGNFNTLVAAVQAGELVETLKGKGPFTVFAPTDEAFAKLDKDTLESLLKPENKDQLVAILTYHVVAGKVMSTDISGDMQPSTVNGSTLGYIKKNEQHLVINLHHSSLPFKNN